MQLKVKSPQKADNPLVKNKVLVFDFDGVILESVTNKMNAFKAWVPEKYAAFRDTFSDYNAKAFGKSRFVQIRYFYEELVKEDISEATLLTEVERFSQLNAKTILLTEWVEGIQDFIRAAYQANYPLYILSGTPQEELENIVEKKGLTHYFKSIIGSPTTKIEGLTQIINKGGYTPKEIFFFGDANADASAAKALAVNFVYRQSEAIFDKQEVYKSINNFLEIIPNEL